MTVTPRYQAYPDVRDTGLKVPLQLPGNGSYKPLSRGSLCVSNELKQDGPHHDLSEPPLQHWASLYHCQQGGVDRIFIDHPLFLHPYSTDSLSNVNTYLQGCDFPNVDLRYSILCQAALAAPILFWHQPADHLHKLRLQALIRCLPKTLSGGITQYVGLDESVLNGLQMPGATRVKQHLGNAPASTQRHKVSVSMVPGPLSLCGGLAHQKPLAAADQSAQQHQHQHGKQRQNVDILWPATAGKIAFVGNDWPCFPLSQHLRHLHCLHGAKASQYEPGTDASNGATQASKPLACTAANSFETHMARLLKSARVAFCIHNLAYQGIFPQESFQRLCLPAYSLSNLQWSSSLSSKPASSEPNSSIASMNDTYMDAAPLASLDARPHCCNAACQDGQQSSTPPQLNWLKGALVSSHAWLTVSHSYAHEIVQDPAAGCGLHDLLNTRSVRGIMNGIDTQEWNPETDRHLPEDVRYSASTVTLGKAAAKALFQERYGLSIVADIPLVGMIGRLAPQKGVDVVLAALPALLAPNNATAGSQVPGQQQSSHQLAILGSGDFWMEFFLGQMSSMLPEQAVGLPQFSEEAAHLLLAAADYLLVPSRFEPCGLVALCALRYGAVPIATPTGGLQDIVTPKVGYILSAIGEYGNTAHLRRDAQALATVTHHAVADYGSSHYLAAQQIGMRRDVSWELPAQEWEEVCQSHGRCLNTYIACFC
ncbi:TPA: hypothetical protein ACH3X2_001585 [Trebouxia sp. C0005]